MKNEFEKINVVWMIVLSFITLGIYFPVWFMKIKEVFDKLDTKQKISRSLIINLLVFTVLELIFTILLFIPGSLIYQVSVYILTNIFSWISIILLLVLAFKVRNALNEHFTEIKFSGIATFLFTIFYLQNRINSLQK